MSLFYTYSILSEAQLNVHRCWTHKRGRRTKTCVVKPFFFFFTVYGWNWYDSQS